ncbi:MAG: hypothetical protein CMF69_04650 [Magnetovibrio sp.]|nr:hypothetical protein [Magnetovibrio sp.]
MWSDRIKNNKITDDDEINERLKDLYEKWEEKKSRATCPSDADTEALINKIPSLIQKVGEKYFPKLSKQVIKEKLRQTTADKVQEWNDQKETACAAANKIMGSGVMKGGNGGPKKADRMPDDWSCTGGEGGSEDEGGGGGDDQAQLVSMVQNESPEFWAMVIVFLAFKLLAHGAKMCQNQVNIDPDWVAFFLALTFALWWAQHEERIGGHSGGGGKQRKKKTRKHKKRRRRRKRRTKCCGRKKRFRTRRFGNWRCYKRVKRRRRSRRRRRRQRRSQHTRKSR